jgi:putative endonuclease
LKHTQMSCYCYILQCADGTFYTGWTTDPERRVAQHNKGIGAKYTSARRPVKLVYLETLSTRTEAMKRELAIKKMKRMHKNKLIEGFEGR